MKSIVQKYKYSTRFKYLFVNIYYCPNSLQRVQALWYAAPDFADHTTGPLGEQPQMWTVFKPFNRWLPTLSSEENKCLLLWNILSLHTRQASLLSYFKSLLKTFIVSLLLSIIKFYLFSLFYARWAVQFLLLVYVSISYYPGFWHHVLCWFRSAHLQLFSFV